MANSFHAINISKPPKKGRSSGNNYMKPNANSPMSEILSAELIGLTNRGLLPSLDYSHKNMKTLVMRFDIDGSSTLEEMRRVDVFKLIQQAAESTNAYEDAHRKDQAQETRHLRKTSTTLTPGYCEVQNVHMRDLRKLDAAFSISNEPTILLRKQAILVKADPIRAVILRELCLVFVPDGADSLLSLLMAKFREEDKESCFEFRAIEAILSTICRILSTDVERTFPAVSQALENLSNVQMSSGELETLRTLKNTMSEFESQVNGIRRALMEILDNEEDLRLLHLTKIHDDPSLLQNISSINCEEAEIMLEAYLQDIHSTRSRVNLMQHRIQNTESLVMLKLDSVRNYLLTADVIFSLVSVCMTFGMFVTGAFGMNLKSGLESEQSYFWGVMITTAATSIVVIFLGVLYFRRRGVIMW